MLKKVSQFFLRNNISKYLLIILGTVSWSLVMVRSGLCWDINCSGGIGFWGANGHDGIWHVALINSLTGGGFDSPIFSGWNLQNYHIGFDLILSWLVRVTKIQTSVLYFQIIPPILACLIGLLTYKFVYLWRKSKAESLLAVFFMYFGGSFGWIVSLFKGQGWGGESMFWSQQATSTLINPSFALSIVLILAGLIYMQKYLAKRTPLNFCLTVIFFGTLIFIKVYAGLLILVSILTTALWQLIIKKDFSFVWVFLAILGISAILFIPFNKSSVGLITFAPFWFLESMMALSDRVGWQRFYSAMTTYRMGHVWLKGIVAYLVAFGIFILGNFGTRIIAAKFLFKKVKNILLVDSVSVFFFTIIFVGIVVPMFFVQKGTPWNTIQFFYFSLIFGGIIAGISVWDSIKNKSNIVKSFALIFLIIITVPTTIASLGNYVSKKPSTILPKTEVEALSFLSEQPKGIVLTYPFDVETALKAPNPRPLYLYTTTAYVSAFSGKQVFLEDEINLDIMQYPWQGRRQQVREFLQTLDVGKGRSLLKENGIAYVYWLTGQRARIGDFQLGMTRIFQNKDVTIFKVN